MRKHLLGTLLALAGLANWAVAADPSLPPLPTTVSEAARTQLVAMAKGASAANTDA